MPAGAFQQDSVGMRINNLADLLTLRAHGLAVAPGHDQAGAVALGRADRPEEVGPICGLDRAGHGRAFCVELSAG